jgi:putative lipoic acid-binding regulatory protein
MSERPPIEELLELPCSFTFRVVAAASPGLTERCVAAVEGVLGRPVDHVYDQGSRSGRYSTVRVEATLHEAREMTEAYEALGTVPGLKMLL